MSDPSVIELDPSTVQSLLRVATMRIRNSCEPRKLHEMLGVNNSATYKWRNTGRVPMMHLINLLRLAGVEGHRFLPPLYEGYRKSGPGWSERPISDFEPVHELIAEHLQRAKL